MSHPHITYYMNKLSKGTSRKAALLISAALSLTLLVSVPLVLNQARKAEESLSSGLAPQILRFHVLANSNSKEDQDLKLEVKQLLIDTMYEDLDGRELSKDELISYVTEHKEELEHTAESFMRSEGYAYPADIRIERCYFPTKVYGDVTFPCGDYDAVRVLLGSGQGNNWWCVLYPPLCFSQSSVCVCSVVILAFHERSRRLYSAFWNWLSRISSASSCALSSFSFLRCSLAVLASFNCALAVASMFSAD